MKKTLATLMVFSLFALPVMSALALNPSAYNGLNHKGKVSQLYLYEKDSSWNIVPDGAWGKMTFSSDSFVFNGHGLEAGQSYTLVNDAEWHSGSVLGIAIADENGNVHIAGATEGITGKVWLVLSSDFTDSVTGWHPSEDLFEYNLI